MFLTTLFTSTLADGVGVHHLHHGAHQAVESRASPAVDQVNQERAEVVQVSCE